MSSVWFDAASKGGKSCQRKPGSHIKSPFVNPFQSLSSKGKKQKTLKKQKNNKRHDSLRHAAVIHCSKKLPKRPPTQTQTAQVGKKEKKKHVWLSGVSSSGLSTQKARRAAALSTCLILASSRRDQQSKALLRYPTIPQCCFFLPGRPTAAACHSLCAQREPGRATKVLAVHRRAEEQDPKLPHAKPCVLPHRCAAILLEKYRPFSSVGGCASCLPAGGHSDSEPSASWENLHGNDSSKHTKLLRDN